MSEDDDRVGYGKPPKTTRFKKGQSGWPDGGWSRRRANLAAAEKAAEEKARKEAAQKAKAELSITQKLLAIARTTRPARIDGQLLDIEAIVAAFLGVQEAAIGKDAAAQRQYFNLIDKMGGFDRLTETPPQQGGVVVLREPVHDTEAWLAEGRSTKLPLDPLEGLPGITREMLEPTFRKTPPEDS